MDDHCLFGDICPVSNPDGYNGTVRSCETSDKVLKVERDKANITVKALHTKSPGDHNIAR